MSKVIAQRAFPTDATKAAFSLGSASVGYVRWEGGLPTDCAAIDIGDALSARISCFMNASTNAKLGQVRVWAGNVVYDAAGKAVGYEAWALGVAIFTSDGLAIASGADQLYSKAATPTAAAEAAKRLGGTVSWKKSSAVAVAAPVSCPPGILTASETIYSEGASDGITNTAGAGVIVLPHLCRKSMLLLDPCLLDAADAATNAAAGINFIVETFRN